MPESPDWQAATTSRKANNCYISIGMIVLIVLLAAQEAGSGDT